MTERERLRQEVVDSFTDNLADLLERKQAEGFSLVLSMLELWLEKRLARADEAWDRYNENNNMPYTNHASGQMCALRDVRAYIEVLRRDQEKRHG